MKKINIQKLYTYLKSKRKICFVVFLLWLAIIILFYFIEIKFPRLSIEKYYKTTCRTAYSGEFCESSIRTQELASSDLDYFAVTHNGLVDKQFVFVYEDRISRNIINVDFVNKYLT